MTAYISRFMDRSASITLEEMKSDWATWPELDRQDFVNGLSWLAEHEDYEGIVRFVVRHVEERWYTNIAQEVAGALPFREAFRFLRKQLEQAGPGGGANYAQALAGMKHPKAERLVYKHLLRTLDHPQLMAPDDHVNWIADDAICCIGFLLDLGAEPDEFEPAVRKLATHPSERTLDYSWRELRKWYPWIDS